MLIDFIDLDKLPWIIVWVDWCFYTYSTSLTVSISIFITHYWVSMQQHSFSGISLAVFIGLCAWIVVCFFRQGWAVG